jgi:hypothetical protein
MSRYTRSQTARLLEVEETFLIQLEEHSIVVLDAEGRYDRFAWERVRISWAMFHTLGVNLEGIDVIVHLLDRMGGERRRALEIVRAELLRNSDDKIK